ncbi:hypothetical protein BG015_005623 [Linnemannia schmuckeri]|uniref:Uncharacterized protein n=1 Tax=Linnemannia schmuckeri TaxID=64567 RepID=A0A9P5R6E4_9FUNG|nr:hypothetical protein BG015_005623 [Linnemannia schmuckeri]
MKLTYLNILATLVAIVTAVPINKRQEPTDAEVKAAIEHVVGRLPADKQEAARARMNTPGGINFVKAGIAYFKDAKTKNPNAVPPVDAFPAVPVIAP